MGKIHRKPDVMWREEDEGTAEATGLLAQGGDASEVGTSILFTDGMMVSLNILGTEIWKRCDGRTIDDIVSELLEEFAVERSVLLQDVNDFIADLAAKGLVYYE